MEKQFLLPAALVLFPKPKSIDGHLRIEVQWPISSANDTSLSAGAGAAIAWSPGIDQCDFGSEPQQIERGPAAENSSADHTTEVFLFSATEIPGCHERAERMSD